MTPDDPQDSPGRLPVLDGLRGVAALTVLVAHAANAGFLPGGLGHGLGQIGVGVFFVLSGFLMSWLYTPRPFSGAELRVYAARRIGRVLPLYLLVVLVAGAGLDILGGAPYRFTGPGDVIAALTLTSGTGVLWSVPVEVHFYLLFPAIWFAAGRGAAAPVLAGLLICGIAFASALAARGAGPQLLPFWLHFFLAGSAAGLWAARAPARLAALTRHPAAAPFAWAVLLAAPLASPAFRVLVLGWEVGPVYRDPVSVAFPLLFLAAALTGRGPFAALAMAPLRRLGAISFGVYLLHPAAIALVKATPGLPVALAFPLVLAGTLSAARLAHLWVERPARCAVAADAAPRPRTIRA